MSKKCEGSVCKFKCRPAADCILHVANDDQSSCILIAIVYWSTFFSKSTYSHPKIFSYCVITIRHFQQWEGPSPSKCFLQIFSILYSSQYRGRNLWTLSNTYAHHACNIATLQCQCTGHHGPSDVKVTSWEAICKFLFPPSWIIASWASELRTSAKSWSTWCSCCGRQPRQTLAPVFIGLFIFIPSAAPLHLQRLSGQWTSSKWVCDRWQPYSYGSRVTWMR